MTYLEKVVEIVSPPPVGMEALTLVESLQQDSNFRTIMMTLITSASTEGKAKKLLVLEMGAKGSGGFCFFGGGVEQMTKEKDFPLLWRWI